MLQQDQKTLLNPDTLLYSELEYFLKTSLSSSTAKIISCYMLSNPHLTEQFKTDCLVLQSLVDSNDLVGGNTEEDVIRRGYQFNKGLLFPIGQFQPKNQETHIHKVLLCDVAVGRSYTVDKHAVESTEIPTDEKSDYFHEYYIKNPSNVLPRFLIQYEYDAKRERESRQKPKCEDCEKEMATVYCEADRAYLCKTCDINLHKTKITKMHVRTAVGQGADVFGNCKHHPSRPVQYFCSQCHEPICIDCTIMGSHSKVEPGKHTLVSVEEYFKTVLEESKLPNPQLEERKIVIHEQIGNIQSRADAVVEMGKQLTAKIDEICAKAKQECNQIIEKKLTVLVGDEHELRRQLGEMEKLEEFLKYQQEGDSMQCVYTWHLHQMYREKLSDFKFFRQDIDVQLDAKVDGSLSVIIDEQKAAIHNNNVTPKHNVTPKRPQLPQRVTSPAALNIPLYPSSPTSPMYSSPPKSAYGGMSRVPNLPSKMKSERKVERRTSDFFHEALSMTRQDSNDDFDTYSQYGYRG